MTDLPPREAIERGVEAPPAPAADLPPRDAIDRGAGDTFTDAPIPVPRRSRIATALERVENSFRYGVVALFLAMGALTAKEFWPAPAAPAIGVAVAETPEPAPPPLAPPRIEAPAPPVRHAALQLPPPTVPPPVVIDARGEDLAGLDAPGDAPIPLDAPNEVSASLAPAMVIPAAPMRPAASQRRSARPRAASAPKSLLQAFFREVGSIPHHARRNARARR
jgi:hypothetical protein